MSNGFHRIIALLLFAFFSVGCVQTLPTKEPLPVAPVQFGERELREVSNIFILTDASGSMWKEKTFPTAKSLSTSFVKALPDARARSRSGDYNVAYIAFGGEDRLAVPLQRFDRQKLLAATEQADIMGSKGGIGGKTPIHAVIGEIGQQLEGKSGATAVVLFSDGVADDSDRALASATALAEGYRGGRLCIYGVQVGEQQDGAEFLRALSGVTACGTSQNAQQLSAPASFQRYAKNVVVGAAPLPPVAAPPPSACAGAIRLRGIEFGFDKAEVTDATTVAGREIAANVVVAHGVGVRARGDRETTAGAAQTAILRYRVVMNVHVIVEPEGPLTDKIEERLADTNATVERAAVTEHVVVGDLKVVGVAVNHDAAADVAARNRQAVDA